MPMLFVSTGCTARSFLSLLSAAVAVALFAGPSLADDKTISHFASPRTGALRTGEGGKSDVPAGTCRVGVRVLLGTKRAEEQASSKRLETGAFLKDLNEQLEPLPFEHYETLSSDERVIHVRERGEFHLEVAGKEQHTIRVEPQSLFREGGYFMVEWVGNAGEKMLSSRLRLLNKKNWVFGTDNLDDTSTIMCIHVNCCPN